jgi:hypothetical protein
MKFWMSCLSDASLRYLLDYTSTANVRLNAEAKTVAGAMNANPRSCSKRTTNVNSLISWWKLNVKEKSTKGRGQELPVGSRASKPNKQNWAENTNKNKESRYTSWKQENLSLQSERREFLNEDLINIMPVLVHGIRKLISETTRITPPTPKKKKTKNKVS